MRLIIMLCLAMLAGCATSVKVESVQDRSFDSLTEMQASDVQPIAMPATLPKTVPAHTEDGQRVSGFTPDGMKSLLQLKNAAESNTAMLTASLEAQKAIVAERNLIVKAAKVEQDRANFYAEKWAVTQNELESERLRYTIMDTTYKVLIGIGLLVAVP